MKVKGINTAYDVEVKKMGENIIVTCGNFMVGMTSVIITKENWEKLKRLGEEIGNEN